MRFSISKNDLVNALTIVSKGRSGRSTLTILSGIYVQVLNGSVVLRATDLEISVTHQTEALVQEEGETVVPGKHFLDIVKSLPDAAIECYTQGSLFNIVCMNSKFSLGTMEAQDFPAFPAVAINSRVSLDSNTLSTMVKKVSKAVARDESHLVLTGINMTIESGSLKMVATDSYRLAVAEARVDESIEDFSLLIPGSTFDEVCRLIPAGETLTIGYSDNQIVFSFGSSTFITRRLEGNYPNYKQIIPSEKSITAIINNKELSDAIKRASLVVQEYKQVSLLFSVEEQKLTISSKAADFGGAVETLEANIEGEDIEIGFNFQYVMDGLSAMDTENVIFEASKPLRPGVFKADGGDNFFYLSMPVKLA